MARRRKGESPAAGRPEGPPSAAPVNAHADAVDAPVGGAATAHATERRPRPPGLRPPWKPGESGNPSGLPKKGPQAFRFRRAIEEAMADPETRAAMIRVFRQVVTSRKRILSAIETGARLTREIGAGAEVEQDRPPFVIMLSRGAPGTYDPLARPPEGQAPIEARALPMPSRPPAPAEPLAPDDGLVSIRPDIGLAE